MFYNIIHLDILSLKHNYFTLIIKTKKTMKTISKIVTIIAFIAIANVTLAVGNLKLNILPLTTEKAVVAISNNTGSTFHISIEDDSGDIIYYKETSEIATDYSKVYDFSRLEKGNYKLHVAVDKEKISKNFSITNTDIKVGKSTPTIPPFFKYENNTLKISFLNFSEENVKINLYNGSDLVYSKDAGNKITVNNGFDLSKLETGDYDVFLTTSANEYNYSFTIE